MGVAPLEAPMHQAMALAWESFRAGSLGIGAVITRDAEVLATGRNRLAETDAGDDILAGTSVAHAEINALTKLPWREHRGDHLTIWTTLQPCLQCAGAIRLGTVDVVQVLAPDPFFRGVERAGDLNEHIHRRWPTFVEREIDEWAALSLLLAWKPGPTPGWDTDLASVGELATRLATTGELVGLATAGATIDDVADTTWNRLHPCLTEIRAVTGGGS